MFVELELSFQYKIDLTLKSTKCIEFIIFQSSKTFVL
jgi:hypothetical protein